MDKIKIAIGSDHGGFRYKGIIEEYLKSKGVEFVDVGTNSAESCDYPVLLTPNQLQIVRDWIISWVGSSSEGHADQTSHFQ